MSGDLQIRFYLGNQEHHVDFRKGGANAVVIGGVSYSLHGAVRGIEVVKKCFEQMPATSRGDLSQVGREIQARLWLRGATGISVALGVHKIGMSILGQNEELDIPAILNEISEAFEKKYVFPEVAKKCSNYLQSQMRKGAYDGISDGDAFTEAVLADLQSIAEDKHIDFYVKPKEENRQIEPAPAASFVEPYAMPIVLSSYDYKAQTDLGWMGGTADRFPYEIRTGFIDQDHKIGFIDLRIFGVTSATDREPEKSDSQTRRQAIIAAVQNIKKSSSVIVDLRNNGGGDPYTVQLLCSLFIEEGLPLNTIAYRGEKQKNFTTLPHAELPREQRLTNAKLFVLISSRTFSAAEEFSNNMKVLQRGTIIGEPSGGGANPSVPLLIGEDGKFILIVPRGEAINPILKGNWEGVGIIPDEFVPADEALAHALHLIH